MRGRAVIICVRVLTVANWKNITKDLLFVQPVSVVRCRNGLLPGNLPKRRKQYNGIRTCLAMTTIWSYNAIKRLFPVPITNATRCR